MKRAFWASLAFGLLATGCDDFASQTTGPASASQSGELSPLAMIGREVSVSRHLEDGEELRLSSAALVEHGALLFSANWTRDEGGGRPLSKGTGAPLSDPSRPLVFPRNFNRISAPDANSCAGCHNAPFGIAGGGGDVVTNVFVLGQRFDFVTFSPFDPIHLAGSLDELGRAVTQQDVGNQRSTLGMFGSGFIEMLARQITAELQAIRDQILPGGSAALVSKGIHFGRLGRNLDGTWDTTKVEGLPGVSLVSAGPDAPPNLVIRPFHQVGRVVSLREFTNNAMNHHHGIQSTERFGRGRDPDGDGFADELTRADVTALTLFQAALPVPQQVIPTDPLLAQAVELGEKAFRTIGCARCHIPSLPLTNGGWIFTEPSPYNPPGNLQVGEAATVSMDLTSPELPGPRLPEQGGVVWVPAFTDLKLHDICGPNPQSPNRELLDMQHPPGSPGFFAGNGQFLTKKLWGAANEPPYFHHGLFTTLRESILEHYGEAQAERAAFLALPDFEQRSLIEFLKSLQVVPPEPRGRPSL